MTQKLLRSGSAIFLLLLLLASSACSDQNILLDGEKPVLNYAVDRLKLIAGEEGVYRVTAGDLEASGIDTGIGLAYENVALSSDSETVPFLIKDNALIFYGQASNSRYFAQRPYMLHIGQPGRAMAGSATQPAGDPPLEQVRKRIRLEEDHNYVPEAREEDSDVWFWSKLAQQDAFTTEFTLPFVAEGEATLRFNIWGFTQNPDVENDHDFEILVNDQHTGTAVFDGQKHYSGEITLPAGLLRSGANKVTLDNHKEGASFLDIMQVNWLEVDYPAPPTAADDRLDFTSHEGRMVLSGLSDSPVVLDVSDPAQPQVLEGWRYENRKVELATVEGQRITAVGPQGFLKPQLEPVHDSNWLDKKQQADLIIITTAELAPALAPLVSAREADGLSVAVITVAEIYDEAGNGAPSPESIRDFVTKAYQNWQAPQPRYLLLVGDATSDYLGRLGELPENIVPSLMVPVQISGETVSDSRLADIDNDKRPELAVGRWPVETVQEVADLVDRTLAYEAGRAGPQAFFATDGSEGSFYQIAGDIIEKGQLARNQVVQANSPTAEEIGELWRDGPWLAAYMGHGSIDQWGKDDIFSLQELDRLKSESVPIVLQLTCLTGLFSSPEQTSLAEGMLLHDNGPVLIVAASSLTYSYHQEPFAVEFLKKLQDSGIVRIGDAFLGAKGVLDVENSEGYREISDTFALFGDPSAKISRP